MNRTTLLVTAFLLAALLACSATFTALAKFFGPTEAPVDRLVKNVSAYVKENPKDAQGYYTLARLHTLAFALNTANVQHYPSEKPGVLPNVEVPYAPVAQGQPIEKPVPITAEQQASHFKDAQANFQEALKLSPDNALYLLGYAYAQESGAPLAKEMPAGAAADAKPDAIKAAWLKVAAANYLKAFRQSIKADAALDNIPKTGFASMISHEAGNAFLRLVNAGAATATDAEKKEVQQGLESLKKLQQGPVTPLIFSLDAARRLDELTNRKTVHFDLDGDLQAEDWPWVQPTTAILVWDPQQAGNITSGRQLFGSVTWWMFWPDAYHALDALDDNRDGELSGDELRGLGVWRDANSNGISEPGEVLPLTQLGVAALSARATQTVDNCPANPHGLRLHDGRTLPTYDWITRPAR